MDVEGEAGARLNDIVRQFGTAVRWQFCTHGGKWNFSVVAFGSRFFSGRTKKRSSAFDGFQRCRFKIGERPSVK